MFDLKIKDMFFDRKAVTDALDKAKRKVLEKGGALIQMVAKSKPGSPRIGFGYDETTDSVVIGPAKLNKPGDIGGRRIKKSERVSAQQLMGPALEKAAPSLPPMWANSVK